MYSLYTHYLLYQMCHEKSCRKVTLEINVTIFTSTFLASRNDLPHDQVQCLHNEES